MKLPVKLSLLLFKATTTTKPVVVKTLAIAKPVTAEALLRLLLEVKEVENKTKELLYITILFMIYYHFFDLIFLFLKLTFY